MCGIVGTVIFRGDCKVDPDLLQRMRDTMQHRGPDGGAQWIDPRGRVGLGHRRLSIIDLSNAATQPMDTPDGRFVITFNGEIYNHAEIRSELQALGRRDWRTDHSDTEVLLFAFREWGIDCLSRFRGMFGFAIWDNQERRLWLVRDRIGIKPIYYAQRADRLSFASEIKALIEDPQQARAMDETALFHYLSLMTTPSPMTLFRGVNKLPSGCWLRLDLDGSIEVRRYWDIWDNVVPMIDRSDDDMAAEIRAMLETAVRYRKVSDVPVGVFLSGGIDSSTNAAMFAAGETRPIKTFSIGYEQDYGSYKNELHYARKMAAMIGADHHELRLKLDDLLSFVPTLIHLQDEPIADPVCVPIYYVSRLAREHGIIVAQVGEGADELFCGYPLWQRILTARRLSELPMPRGLRRIGVWALDRYGRGDHYFREMLRRAANDEPFFFSGAETFTDFRKTQLLSSRMRAAFAGRTSAEAVGEIRRRFNSKAWERSPLNWMSYVDLNLRLPELLLMRVDKMSMGVSVECRVPFLDHKFVELAMGIPAAAKTRNGTLKYILKKAVTGVIPDELIHRRKQGFGVPIAEWFSDRLGGAMRREITRFCEATDVFDRAYVERLFQQNDGVSLWWLYNLSAWHAHFIERKEIAAAA